MSRANAMVRLTAAGIAAGNAPEQAADLAILAWRALLARGAVEETERERETAMLTADEWAAQDREAREFLDLCHADEER